LCLTDGGRFMRPLFVVEISQQSLGIDRLYLARYYMTNYPKSR
jgi:hypothetical protein